MMRSCISLAVVSIGAPVFAQVTLNASINVDNAFTAYISTSPTLDGTSFLSGTSWPTTETGTFVFPAAGTYYLHVLAIDQGPPAMFIGTFSLSNDNGSTFSNGTTSLGSNSTNWVVSNTGFGVGEVAPIDIGPNGTGPWGNFAGHSASSHFLWAPNSPFTVYFTTVINVVPAPTSAVALGMAGLAMTRRRR